MSPVAALLFVVYSLAINRRDPQRRRQFAKPIACHSIQVLGLRRLTRQGIRLLCRITLRGSLTILLFLRLTIIRTICRPILLILGLQLRCLGTIRRGIGSSLRPTMGMASIGSWRVLRTLIVLLSLWLTLASTIRLQILLVFRRLSTLRLLLPITILRILSQSSSPNNLTSNPYIPYLFICLSHILAQLLNEVVR